jgi:glycosyltransferase involved in cell wall biosynthesis
MNITVAICTWNRAELLRSTLEHFRGLDVPQGLEWELLVVNNRCTDHTDDVIEEFTASLPIRRIFEPQPGKSHALNAAVEAAGGGYILWTDDDVVVDKDWIRAYADAFVRWPEAAVFCGPIEPHFPTQPDDWLVQILDDVGSAYALFDLGSEPEPLTWRTVPYGANYAVRTREQRMYRFDPELGPRPDSALRGEEVVLLRRMFEGGISGWWVPAARVKHVIPAERQTMAYLRRYFRGYGELLARTRRETDSAMLLGRPRWLWRCAVEEELRYRFWRLRGKPDRWIGHLKRASTAWGQLMGSRGNGPR